MSDRAGHGETEKMLAALVTTCPLAWLVSPDLSDATLLPLLPILGSSQKVVALEGHMSRSNRHLDTLGGNGRASVLYKGPDSYMPTVWIEVKTLALTWVFSSVVFHVDVQLLPADEYTQAHLHSLVAFMENAAASDWRTERMGRRFEKLAAHVMAFRATVRSVRHSFKLGQNESPAVFRQMISGLQQANRHDVATWMERAYPHAF
jgi:transcriptional regulator